MVLQCIFSLQSLSSLSRLVFRSVLVLFCSVCVLESRFLLMMIMMMGIHTAHCTLFFPQLCCGYVGTFCAFRFGIFLKHATVSQVCLNCFFVQIFFAQLDLLSFCIRQPLLSLADERSRFSLWYIFLHILCPSLSTMCVWRRIAFAHIYFCQLVHITTPLEFGWCWRVLLFFS